MEDHQVENKSIRIIDSKDGYKSLAKACVAFANTKGGILNIGIEDDTNEPPLNQTINQKILNKIITQLRAEVSGVVFGVYQIEQRNNSDYIAIKILPSSTIATTSKGEVYIRVGDHTKPVTSEEIMFLASDRGAFNWELSITCNIKISELDSNKVNNFINYIKNSNRISNFIRAKSNEELLEYYCLIDNKLLTNLGILWLGTNKQRAKLVYPLTIQYIVYDSNENKVNKIQWDSLEYNPKELLEEVENKAIELNYTTEIPKGLFREQIPLYAREVIRELLVNAIVHRNYSISNDIKILLYENRLEIISPGSLPFGITPNNILHEQYRRNQHLTKIFMDLGYMESGGSGYDLIYERLIHDAKPLPLIETDFNKTKITIYPNIVNLDALWVIQYLDTNYQLTQKEKITAGIIAVERKISAIDLSKKLQLEQETRLKQWLSNLLKQEVIITRGHKKGTHYLLNPKFITNSGLNLTTTLKTIEDHRLKALIEEDIRLHPQSSISSIKKRLIDVEEKDIRRLIYGLVKSETINFKGEKKGRKYFIA